MPRIAQLAELKLLEQHVTKQVKDFLEFRKWRPIRMQRTVVPGQFQTGEPGMPDFCFCKYLDRPPGASCVLWVEFKAPAGKLRKHQPEWHMRERLKGALVWVVDDLDDFEQRYYRTFGWLHSGDAASGQLDLLAAVRR